MGLPHGYETYHYADHKPLAHTDPETLAKLGSCLRWDAERGEAYLQLPSHPELRLVPWRRGFEDDLVEHYNDHEVGKRQYDLPYPSAAEEMISKGLQEHSQRGTLALLKSRMAPSSSSNGVNGHLDPRIPPLTSQEAAVLDNTQDYLEYPFPCLYDVDRDKMVGKLTLRPHGYDHADIKYTPDEVRAMPREKQMWDMGYGLHRSLRGKGIATEFVSVLIESWVKPWMRVGVFGAITEPDNPASQAVLLKNGLKMVSKGQVWDWPEEKGGGTRETARYERHMR